VRPFAARFSIVIAGSLFTAQLGFAQTSISLRDAIALAVSHRPELRASSAKVESSGGLRQQASLRPNPRQILQSEDFHPSNFSFSQQSQTYAYASQVFEAPTSYA
jgi:hypothetical protein